MSELFSDKVRNIRENTVDHAMKKMRRSSGITFVEEDGAARQEAAERRIGVESKEAREKCGEDRWAGFLETWKVFSNAHTRLVTP